MGKHTQRIPRIGSTGRLLTALGWGGVIFWGTIAVMGALDIFRGYTTHDVNGEQVVSALETVDYVATVLCAVFAALHIWMILSGRRAKQRAEDFRRFTAFFAAQTEKSIPALAASLNRPEAEVISRVEDLCRKGYFNGFVDHRTRSLCFYADDPANSRLTVSCCPGCGAKTAVANQGGVCRYCGSPLTPAR